MQSNIRTYAAELQRRPKRDSLVVKLDGKPVLFSLKHSLHILPLCGKN